MAEALAVVATVASCVQLADFGAKLSVKLFTFSQTAASAEESIKAISSDVSLTSTVLRELSVIITADESKVISPAAIDATTQTLGECLTVFEQFNETLDKCLRNVETDVSVAEKEKTKKGMGTLDMLKWPFKQPKMDLLRSNLDRLKASLSLMLQVLSYARDIANQKAAKASMAYQQHLIEVLARSKKSSENRYHTLQLSLAALEAPPPFHTLVADPAMDVTPSRGIDAAETGIAAKPVNEKTTALVRELLACFEIMDDLLDDHYAARRRRELSEIGYNKLMDAMETVKSEEFKRLSSQRQTKDSEQGEKVEALELVLTRIYSMLSHINPAFKVPNNNVEAERINYSYTEPVSINIPPRMTAGDAEDITIASKLVRENMLRATIKGERLDSLQNQIDDADKMLSEAVLNARSKRRGFWRRPFNKRSAVDPHPGKDTNRMDQRPIKDLRNLVTMASDPTMEPRRDQSPEAHYSHPGIPPDPGNLERRQIGCLERVDKRASTDNDVSDDEDVDIVADLLAKWTMLPKEQLTTEAEDTDATPSVQNSNAGPTKKEKNSI